MWPLPQLRFCLFPSVGASEAVVARLSHSRRSLRCDMSYDMSMSSILLSEHLLGGLHGYNYKALNPGQRNVKEEEADEVKARQQETTGRSVLNYNQLFQSLPSQTSRHIFRWFFMFLNSTDRFFFIVLAKQHGAHEWLYGAEKGQHGAAPW